MRVNLILFFSIIVLLFTACKKDEVAVFNNNTTKTPDTFGTVNNAGISTTKIDTPSINQFIIGDSLYTIPGADCQTTSNNGLTIKTNVVAGSIKKYEIVVGLPKGRLDNTNNVTKKYAISNLENSPLAYVYIRENIKGTYEYFDVQGGELEVERNLYLATKITVRFYNLIAKSANGNTRIVSGFISCSGTTDGVIQTELPGSATTSSTTSSSGTTTGTATTSSTTSTSGTTTGPATTSGTTSTSGTTTSTTTTSGTTSTSGTTTSTATTSSTTSTSGTSTGTTTTSGTTSTSGTTTSTATTSSTTSTSGTTTSTATTSSTTTTGSTTSTSGTTTSSTIITDNTINFTTLNTAVTENFDSYKANGFKKNPGTGELDADDWRIDGMSDGVKNFGTEKSSGDFTGSATNTSSTGGLNPFVDTFNASDVNFGISPTTSDFDDGSITLRIPNNTGATINSIDVAYSFEYLNNNPRSHTFNFSHSTDNKSFTNVSSLDDTTPGPPDSAAFWQKKKKSTTLSVTIPVGGYIFLKWSSKSSGSNGSDEIGLDDLSITPH